MNAAGPVLRDIHVPPAAWWPPAPGWWLLALAVVLLLAAVLATWRHRKAGATLAAALREVDALALAHPGGSDPAGLAESASRLLRRVALRVEPEVASDNGAAWRGFVLGHAPDAASREALEALLDARFRARPVLDSGALLQALRSWCREALREPRAARDALRRRRGLLA